MVPAGYLVGGLDDLAAFARTQLAGGPVLDDAARSLLHTPEVTTGDDSGYGLGWRTWRVPGGDAPMVWHGGAAPGYQAAVLLLPSVQRAVVVLQNAYGPFQEDALLQVGWGVAALLTGATPPAAAGTDPIYPVALVTLTVLVLALVVGVAGTVWRLSRRGRPRRRTVQLGAVIGLGLLVAVLLRLPGLAGVTLAGMGLWVPDLAWLLRTALALAVVLGALRLMVLGLTLFGRRNVARSNDCSEVAV